MNIFDKLDAIRSKVDASTIEPIFSDEVDSRNSRYENTVETEKNNLLRVMAALIAFSNNAPSDAVGYMVENGVFERVFCSFDLDKVANLNPDEIITTDWNNIKSIRFKKKVDAIVRCAKLLIKSGKEKATMEFWGQYIQLTSIRFLLFSTHGTHCTSYSSRHAPPHHSAGQPPPADFFL